MNSEKYIGLDVHQATISVAVMDSKGKVVMESILETKATTILEFLAGLRGTLSVTFEEGTWAAWLYDLLKPHVANLVVCNPRKNALLKHGNKSDKIDARKLADLLRLNDLEPVYHGETGVRMLRELARSYLTIVKDLSRVMNRLKALYRSWAIPCAGRDVYYTRHRSEWLGKIPRPAPAAEPSNFISNWTCCSTCASKRGANCWRRVASMPSLPSYDRFRPWADSLCVGGGSDPDPASFSHQATALDLQRTGVGNSRQRGIPLRARPSAAPQKAGVHSRLEQGSQP